MPGIFSRHVRLNLFWKLGFAFFALLIAVLLPVDYYAERTLRSDYERAGFDQLSAIARIALATPPPASSLSTTSHTASPALAEWVTRMAASGVRVTVITVTRTPLDRKSTRLNSSHRCISYAVFCLKKKK